MEQKSYLKGALELELDLLLESDHLTTGYNLLKILLLLVAGFFINKCGLLLINKLAKKEDTGAQQEEVKSNLILALKTLLQYGLILLIIILSLEIFGVDILEIEHIRQGFIIIVKIIGIIILANITLKLGKMLIDNLLNGHNSRAMIKEARRLTLSSLMKSLLTYVIYFIAGIMMLDAFGINTGSILAGVGVLGLGISFGAQNLVRDIISGFFIIFEEQYNVGEYITISAVTGTVIELGLRTTQIQEWTGELHTIPNGEISKVTNFSRNEILAVVIMNIAHEEDIDKAISVLTITGQRANQELEDIKEEPLVQGVIEIGESYVSIRTVVKTTPGEQWAVERELRKRFKQALDDHEIEIPYPRRTIISKSQDTNR